ncbi:serine/threonine-protein kinase [Jatrophihabitans fulvus]
MSDFEILGRVSGGSATVWQARDVALDRVVALKEVPGDDAVREARALASLDSPHLVRVHGVVTDAGRTFVVEEWVDGATLRDVLREAGTLSREQALGVVRGALFGLADIHRAGLVHGDVSPGNVLVDTAGRSRMVDLGSAVRSGDEARPSTGAYAAPETTAGRAVTPAADVYAAAAVLAALLHGRTEREPSTKGVDAGLRPVLDRALSSDPDGRFPDAAAFLAALDDAATDTYGSGWWTEAGLGAAAGAAAAGLVAAGLGAPFSGAGVPIAVLDDTVGPTVGTAYGGAAAAGVKAARGSLRSRYLLGGGAAAAVVAVGAMAVALTGGDDDPGGPNTRGTTSGVVAAGSGGSPSAATTSATPSNAAPTVTVIRYRAVTTVTVATGSVTVSVGQRDTTTWTIRRTCAVGRACSLSLMTTSTGTTSLSGTGGVLRSTTRTPFRCVETKSGKTRARSEYTIVRTLYLPADGSAATGKGTYSASGPAIASCPATRVESRTVLTRIG